MWSSILINGGIAALLSIIFLTNDAVKGLFTGGHELGTPGANASFLTAFFAFFVFMHVFNTFNARSQGLNLFENFFDNKLFPPVISIIIVVQTLIITFGGEIMRTVGLTAQEWMYVLMFAFVLVPVDLTRKIVRNMTVGNPVLSEAHHLKPL
jgi:magnesium-transporting ATPase (P-type)